MASLFQNIFKSRKETALVLMYHRIASASVDPWDLCVSPENFEEHIEYLKDKFQVIPMHELAARILEERSLKNLISLTFDDGYLDNFTEAKPILEKYSVPATFYLTAKFEAPEKSYWWDILEQIILTTPTLPQKLALNIPAKQFVFDLQDSSTLTASAKIEIAQWRYGHPLYNKRLELFYTLWMEMKPMSIAGQQKTITNLREWAGIQEIYTPPLMNEAHIMQMATNPLFEIGAHTVNHPALAFLPAGEQKNEIQKGRYRLEKLTGRSITGLAYPYGSLNQDTPLLTQTLGFDYAVSTSALHVTHRSAMYDLPRFQVKNMNRKDFAGMLIGLHQSKV